jgi:hypothetical protein
MSSVNLSNESPASTTPSLPHLPIPFNPVANAATIAQLAPNYTPISPQTAVNILATQPDLNEMVRAIAYGLVSTAERSPMRSRLRSTTKPIVSYKRSSRSTLRRSTRTSSSQAAPMGMSPMMAASRPSSPSEKGSSYLPSSSSSETTDEFCVYPGRSITRNRTRPNFSFPLTTHRKTSPTLSLSGSTLCSTALPPPIIHSVAPLPTSTTGMPPPKSSDTTNKTTDYATSATNSPSSRPRCTLLKMTSQRAATASKPPASHPAFRIWKEGHGPKITPCASAPSGEELVRDQEVQTKTGGDDTVIYLRLCVVRTNWA